MAGIYLEVDQAALVRLAGLVDRASRGEAGATVLAEVRQLEDRFGLSPLARRRLQWELERPGANAVPAGSEDEGRWLRVVSD